MPFLRKSVPGDGINSRAISFMSALPVCIMQSRGRQDTSLFSIYYQVFFHVFYLKGLVTIKDMGNKLKDFRIFTPLDKPCKALYRNSAFLYLTGFTLHYHWESINGNSFCSGIKNFNP